jgi:hypothetical protein
VKQGNRRPRSIVSEEEPFVWCVTCKVTKRVGELGDCLQSGHELIERCLTIQKVR